MKFSITIVSVLTVIGHVTEFEFLFLYIKYLDPLKTVKIVKNYFCPVTPTNAISLYQRFRPPEHCKHSEKIIFASLGNGS